MALLDVTGRATGPFIPSAGRLQFILNEEYGID
jgi:hypothetical protein